MVQTFLLAVIIVAGTYSAIFIGYILVPVIIFMFVLYVVHITRETMREDA